MSVMEYSLSALVAVIGVTVVFYEFRELITLIWWKLAVVLHMSHMIQQW